MREQYLRFPPTAYPSRRGLMPAPAISDSTLAPPPPRKPSVPLLRQLFSACRGERQRCRSRCSRYRIFAKKGRPRWGYHGTRNPARRSQPRFFPVPHCPGRVRRGHRLLGAAGWRRLHRRHHPPRRSSTPLPRRVLYFAPSRRIRVNRLPQDCHAISGAGHQR